MATKKQISIILRDAESHISYGVSVNYAKAQRKALQLAELTGRSILIESKEIIYPDLPF